MSLRHRFRSHDPFRDDLSVLLKRRFGEKPSERLLLAALRVVHQLVGVALGLALQEQRKSFARDSASGDVGPASADPRDALIFQLRVQRDLLLESAELLAERLTKLPERRRPHFLPDHRRRILRVKDVLGLSQRRTARLFAVSPQTVGGWEAEIRKASADPTRPPRARPVPPVRRYADAVRQVIQLFALLGLGGDAMLARAFTRVGVVVSARTIGRIRKEKHPAPLPPVTHSRSTHNDVTTKTRRVVFGKRPLHTVLCDVTQIPGLFSLFAFKLVTLFDAYSRMPLGWRLFTKEPSAQDVAALFRSVASRLGFLKHLVTDQGACFTADVFQETVRRRGTRQRFGAIGKVGSIALIERFWRTLKALAKLKTPKALLLEDLKPEVDRAMLFYAAFRPHSALASATPLELFTGLRPAHLDAVHPPRGQPGEVVPFDAPRVEFLDDHPDFPVLLPPLRDAA